MKIEELVGLSNDEIEILKYGSKNIDVLLYGNLPALNSFYSYYNGDREYKINTAGRKVNCHLNEAPYGSGKHKLSLHINGDDLLISVIQRCENNEHLYKIVKQIFEKEQYITKESQDKDRSNKNTNGDVDRHKKFNLWVAGLVSILKGDEHLLNILMDNGFNTFVSIETTTVNSHNYRFSPFSLLWASNTFSFEKNMEITKTIFKKYTGKIDFCEVQNLMKFFSYQFSSSELTVKESQSPELIENLKKQQKEISELFKLLLDNLNFKNIKNSKDNNIADICLFHRAYRLSVNADKGFSEEFSSMNHLIEKHSEVFISDILERGSWEHITDLPKHLENIENLFKYFIKNNREELEHKDYLQYMFNSKEIFDLFLSHFGERKLKQLLLKGYNIPDIEITKIPNSMGTQMKNNILETMIYAHEKIDLSDVFFKKEFGYVEFANNLLNTALVSAKDNGNDNYLKNASKLFSELVKNKDVKHIFSTPDIFFGNILFQLLKNPFIIKSLAEHGADIEEACPIKKLFTEHLFSKKVHGNDYYSSNYHYESDPKNLAFNILINVLTNKQKKELIEVPFHDMLDIIIESCESKHINISWSPNVLGETIASCLTFYKEQGLDVNPFKKLDKTGKSLISYILNRKITSENINPMSYDIPIDSYNKIIDIAFDYDPAKTLKFIDRMLAKAIKIDEKIFPRNVQKMQGFFQEKQKELQKIHKLNKQQTIAINNDDFSFSI